MFCYAKTNQKVSKNDIFGIGQKHTNRDHLKKTLDIVKEELLSLILETADQDGLYLDEMVKHTKDPQEALTPWPTDNMY